MHVVEQQSMHGIYVRAGRRVTREGYRAVDYRTGGTCTPIRWPPPGDARAGSLRPGIGRRRRLGRSRVRLGGARPIACR